MPSSAYQFDFYDRLGLGADADNRQIRRHYRLLARLYHPDINAEPSAHARFLSLREAYETLGDPQSRSLYDRWLEQEGQLWQPLLLSQQLYPSTILRGHDQQRAYMLLDLGVHPESVGSIIPLNVVLVLDHSSSMKGRRLYYVKEAARQILSNLTPHDFFGVVIFNDRGSVVLPAGPADNVTVAYSAIDGINAAGGTEMASGLHLGLKEVRRHLAPHLVNHIILLTDGRTYGDDQQCLQLAAQASEEGIGITAMGLGTEWNEELLDSITRYDVGSAHFIAEPDQAVGLFQSQIQQLQHASARDARLVVAPGPGVSLLRAHEVAPGLRPLKLEGDTLHLGTLPVAPSLRLLLEFEVQRAPRDVVEIAALTLQAHLVRNARQSRIKRLALAEVGSDSPEPPSDIYHSAQRVATLRLQQWTWEALEGGARTRAISSLEDLADRFMEIGAMDLAIATQREVATFEQTGQLSESGRKIIKYGTRMLALPAPDEGAP